jgi:DNA modification methylase
MQIKIKCKGSANKKLESLKILQGDLKELSEVNRGKLRKRIEQFGFDAPFFVYKNHILDGTQRLKVLQGMVEDGWTLPAEGVPVVEIKADSIEDAKLRILGYVSQFGKLTSEGLSEFIIDMDGLDYELLDLPDFDIDEFLEDTGGGGEGGGGLTDEDAIPEDVKTICKAGDLWQLGDHRVMCGDSTKKEDVERLMGGEKADMVFTDPPYNVDYSNIDRPKPSKKDLGKIKNDVMSVEDFGGFVLKILINLYEATKTDSSLYFWYASASASAILNAFDQSEWERNQEVIWKKPMLLGRGKYQWAHEPCIFAIKGHPWFTEDRTKTTVWDFGGYDKSKNMHPTQKPVFLPEEAIGNSSKIGETVLDLFLGSGSTLIACEKTNRRCFGMELDEHYCDVIISRFEEYTGKKAKKLK